MRLNDEIAEAGKLGRVYIERHNTYPHNTFELHNVLLIIGVFVAHLPMKTVNYFSLMQTQHNHWQLRVVLN